MQASAETDTTKLPKERFHFLDGLRAVAVSLVVMQHAFTTNIMTILNHYRLNAVSAFIFGLGQSGVELFFVLSGVVLLRPYLRGEKKFEAGKYFVRRFKRIYPSYFAALCIGSFVIWLNNFIPTWYSIILVQFSWKGALSQTFMFSTNGFYYNLAWWSLQIEMTFYIVAPLIVFFYHKKKQANDIKFYCTLLLITAISVFAQVYLSTHYPALYDYGKVNNIYRIIDYPVCFALGVYLAARNPTVQQGIAFALAGILIIAASFLYTPISHAGYGLLYAGIIILAFHKQKLRNRLSAPFMIWLGERSYSLFLIHYTAFYFTDFLLSLLFPGRTLAYGILAKLLGIAMALFSAMLLFYFVERKQAKGLVTDKCFWPWQVRK